MTKSNVPTYTLIVGAKAIDKAIASITNRGAKLDRDIQIAALSAMQHHVEHGDVTLINRLIAAMPKGMRSNALRAFIETFGAVAYDTKAKSFVHVKGGTFNLTGASEVLWVDFKPEAEYAPITSDLALVKALIKRMETDMDKMGAASKVNADVLNGLRALTRPTDIVPAHIM